MLKLFQKRQQSISGRVSSGDKFLGRNPKIPIWEWPLLGLVILFVALVRIRLLGFPLERDEGEYAYFGQLILQGIPPYQLAYNMKFPGIYALFAVFEGLFGQTLYGVHLGLLVANVATILTLFFLCKKLASGTAAIIASATYGVLSLSPSVLGFAAHATQFVAPFVVAGFLLLLKAFEHPRRWLFFLAGTLLGLAVLMKQSAAPFCLWGLVAIALNGTEGKSGRRKQILSFAVFAAGVIMPIAATFIFLYAAGVFDKFWFWTVTYLWTYAAQVSFSDGVSLFWANASSVIGSFRILWILALLGFCVVCAPSRFKGKRSVILSFAFFSFLSVCQGFNFRSHYFITFLPAVSILVGIFFDFLCSKGVCRKAFVLALFLASLSIGVVAQRDYFFLQDPMKLSRIIYGGNPFPESLEIANVLQAMTRKDESIAVLGSEPQLFFYSKRHSATGHVYMYGLMENQVYSRAMQEEMVKEIEAADPRVIVFVSCFTSWLPNPGASSYVFQWWNKLVREKKYQKVGVVDIFSNGTIYRFGMDAKNYEASSLSHALIYERVDGRTNLAPTPKASSFRR